MAANREAMTESAQSTGPAPNSEALLAVIAQMLRELRAGAEPPVVRLDDMLDRDLGIDSLGRVELALRVERAFGVRLAESTAAVAQTPRDLLRAIRSGAPGTAPVTMPGRGMPALPVTEGAPDSAQSLLEVFDWHLARHPQRAHISVLGADEQAETLSYQALAADASRVAAELAGQGLEPGEAVALMLPTGVDFFRSFLGVMMAGGIPVPIYPPATWSRIEEHVQRQSRILANCGARTLITVREAAGVARLLGAQAGGLQRVLCAAEMGRAGSQYRRPPCTADDIAFLQYTSGSTGNPKGVVLTHANLLGNLRAMGRAVKADSRDVFVSWLPLYHDMGLIGAWFGSMYYAFRLAVMPPTLFLQRPVRWLREIHHYRATLSAAPNFAYEILASRVDDADLEGLDLSSLRILFNGAEPVRAETLARFAKRFSRFGFDPRAMTPVFGLAESALGVTFPPIGRGPLIDHVDRGVLAQQARAVPVSADSAVAMHVVSCGMPIPNHEVRVVDESERELPERTEGRVEFRGPSATTGYYRNPDATRSLFRGDWLDTGDVGYLAAGELYLTSRAKDLIIRGGQHVHPYELEQAIGDLPGVRKGCVAVFGATDRASGTERVIVLVESRETEPTRREALRARIAEVALAHLGVPADDIVLAGSHIVLKTSSGKIRRAACRELYEKGTLSGSQRSVFAQLTGIGLRGALAVARRSLRTPARWGYGAYFWTLLIASGLATAAIVSLVPGQARRARLAHAAARGFLRASGLAVVVEGLDNLQPGESVVVVANHASYLDGIVLAGALPGGFGFAIKAELARFPLIGRFLGRIGARFVERFDPQRGIEDTRSLVDAARGGESIVFFPEGTLSRVPGLAPFRMGAFVTSAGSGRPLVPVTLRGTRSVLRDGSWLPVRGVIRVLVDTPLAADGDDWNAAVALRDRARTAILAHCGEPDLSTQSA